MKSKSQWPCAAEFILFIRVKNSYYSASTIIQALKTLTGPCQWFKDQKRRLHVGACSQFVDLSKPTQFNLTRRIRLVFRAWGLGWVINFFFYSGSSLVWVIIFQIRQTQPDPPIYLIYIFKIYYIINKIFKIISSSYPI